MNPAEQDSHNRYGEMADEAQENDVERDSEKEERRSLQWWFIATIICVLLIAAGSGITVLVGEKLRMPESASAEGGKKDYSSMVHAESSKTSLTTRFLVVCGITVAALLSFLAIYALIRWGDLAAVASLLTIGTFGLCVFLVVSLIDELASVRAIIATIFSIGTIGLALIIVMAVFFARIKEQDGYRKDEIDKRFAQAKQIFSVLAGIVGTVVGFYFGMSGDEKQAALPLQIVDVLASNKEPIGKDTVEMRIVLDGGKPPFIYDVTFESADITIPPIADRNSSNRLIKETLDIPQVAKQTPIRITVSARDSEQKEAPGFEQDAWITIQPPAKKDNIAIVNLQPPPESRMRGGDEIPLSFDINGGKPPYKCSFKLYGDAAEIVGFPKELDVNGNHFDLPKLQPPLAAPLKLPTDAATKTLGLIISITDDDGVKGKPFDVEKWIVIRGTEPLKISELKPLAGSKQLFDATIPLKFKVLGGKPEYECEVTLLPKSLGVTYGRQKTKDGVFTLDVKLPMKPINVDEPLPLGLEIKVTDATGEPYDVTVKDGDWITLDEMFIKDLTPAIGEDITSNVGTETPTTPLPVKFEIVGGQKPYEYEIVIEPPDLFKAAKKQAAGMAVDETIQLKNVMEDISLGITITVKDSEGKSAQPLVKKRGDWITMKKSPVP